MQQSMQANQEQEIDKKIVPIKCTKSSQKSS